MTSLERILLFLQPISDYLVPFFGFDALVSLVLAVLVATVILQNRRKNQSTTSEVENLIRRYIIFRGRRQVLMRVHQKDASVRDELLKAISNSWNHLKNMLERYSMVLRETDRRARNLLSIIAVCMILNSARTLAFGILVDRTEWKGVVWLVKELPMYFFLLTGFLLISIQSRRFGKRPLTTFTAELDAIFSDTEQHQEALDNEFDPIDQSFLKEEPWPEES
jgi:hypothetical protein